ncbi:hypothetical protein E4U39_005484 [Claviceps sp. Clav50 group G5]|nr:hypothetical protein E4U39_005484 [Claviceps sp. Clav50 group G5]
MASHPQVRGHFKEEAVSDASGYSPRSGAGQPGSLRAGACCAELRRSVKGSASMKQQEKGERHRSQSEIVMGSHGQSWEVLGSLAEPSSAS